MHADSGSGFQGGPEPRAGADWLLSVLGPDGDPADKWWPKVITFSGSPVHKTMFDKYVVKNTDYPEIADSYKAIPNSIIMPVVVGASYPATQTKIWPWLERFWVALNRSFEYTGLYVVGLLFFGLLGSVLISSFQGQKEASVYRVIAYMPVVLPIAVALLLWRQLLNNQFGYVNHLLKDVLGLPA